MTVESIAGFLSSIGFSPESSPAPSSEKRFPDGGQFRIEIPSTEGPECLEAVLSESERLDVAVHRVSQGSGVFMLTDRELDEMAGTAAAARVEVSLFARPNAAWGTSATARVHGAFAAPAYGLSQVACCLADCARAAEHGYRSVLIADIGVLAVFRQAKDAGLLPASMQAKISVMLPTANPPAARVLETLGAGTINVVTDLGISDLAALRAAVDVPIDVYVEAPDNVGGFVRHHEIPEIIRVAAPVYIKFGLRNAPDIYPSGSHLQSTAVALSRERVRRARLGMELLERSGADVLMSPLGAADLCIPSTGKSE